MASDFMKPPERRRGVYEMKVKKVGRVRKVARVRKGL